MKIRNYKDLDVWKKGIEIVDFVYAVTSRFPADERFGLAAHIRKTAVSIPSNIAEGFLRRKPTEYRQFLYISLGSCGELETQTIVAERRSYLSGDEFVKLEDLIDHELKMLMNLIKSLRV